MRQPNQLELESRALRLRGRSDRLGTLYRPTAPTSTRSSRRSSSWALIAHQRSNGREGKAGSTSPECLHNSLQDSSVARSDSDIDIWIQPGTDYTPPLLPWSSGRLGRGTCCSTLDTGIQLDRRRRLWLHHTRLGQWYRRQGPQWLSCMRSQEGRCCSWFGRRCCRSPQGKRRSSRGLLAPLDMPIQRGSRCRLQSLPGIVQEGRRLGTALSGRCSGSQVGTSCRMFVPWSSTNQMGRQPPPWSSGMRNPPDRPCSRGHLQLSKFQLDRLSVHRIDFQGTQILLDIKYMSIPEDQTPLQSCNSREWTKLTRIWRLEDNCCSRSCLPRPDTLQSDTPSAPWQGQDICCRLGTACTRPSLEESSILEDSAGASSRCSRIGNRQDRPCTAPLLRWSSFLRSRPTSMCGQGTGSRLGKACTRSNHPWHRSCR